MKKSDSLSNYARSNKTVMKAHLIDVTVMNVFCFLQVQGGLQPGRYVLITLFLGFLPIILAASVYNDEKYSIGISLVVILESLIVIIGGAATGKFGYISMDYGIIQNKTGLVYDAIHHISDNMQQTLEALHTGNEDVSLLVEKVEASVVNGEKVAEKLKLLDKSVEEMNSITEVISTIAKQIGLLANYIEELKEANKLITDSVETISAVSEEVSAHAAETITAEGENVTILERIDQKMQKLMDLIEN